MSVLRLTHFFLSQTTLWLPQETANSGGGGGVELVVAYACIVNSTQTNTLSKQNNQVKMQDTQKIYLVF